MRFGRDKREKKTNKGFGKFLQRAVLTATVTVSLLCTGCGSIIFNGNLSFQAYEPVKPLSANEGIRDAVLSYGDQKKYEIEGTSAFLVLPYHMNTVYLETINNQIQEQSSDPDHVELYKSEFKLIDYNETEQAFIYAYYTPYFGPQDSNVTGGTGVTVDWEGNASGLAFPKAQKASDINSMVLTMMMYKPETKDYRVMFSTLVSKEQDQENEVRLLAGKVAGQEAYYIYNSETTFIFDREGNQLFSRKDFATISQKSDELVKKVKGENGLRSYPYRRTTVTDVQMDKDLYTYYTIQVEISKESLQDGDAKAEELLKDDKEYGDDDGDESQYEEIGGVEYLYGSFSVFELVIGGKNNEIQFTSSIDAEKLKKAIDEETRTFVQTTTIHGTRPPIGSKEDEMETVYDRFEEAKTANQAAIESKLQLYDILHEYVNGQVFQDAMSSFSIFDTADMTKRGVNLYYALVAQTDSDNWQLYEGILPSGEANSTKNTREASQAVRNIRINGEKTIRWFLDSGIFFQLARQEERDKHNVLMQLHNAIRGFSVGDMQYKSMTGGKVMSSPWVVPGKYGVDNVTIPGVVENGLYKYSSGGKTKTLIGHRQPLYIYDFQREVNELQGDHYSVRKDTENGVTTGIYLVDKASYLGTKPIYYYSSRYRAILQSAWIPHFPVVGIYRSVQRNTADGSKGVPEYLTMSVQKLADETLLWSVPFMVIDEAETIEIVGKGEIEYYETGLDEPLKEEMATKKVEYTFPTKYRMIIPEGTKISYSGDIWPGRSIRTLDTMGVVTFGDEGDGTCFVQEAVSDKGIIHDTNIPGTAQDLGLYKVGDDRMLAFFTDKGIRLYNQVNSAGNFQLLKNISREDLQKAVSGYGLSTQTADTNKKATNAQEMATGAIENSENVELDLTAESIVPVSSLRLLYLSTNTGIQLLNMMALSTTPLIKGAYYGAFPLSDGKYMVVGFQTNDYDYVMSDMSMAKCYVFSLAEMVRKQSNDTIQTELKRLRDYYMNVTHRLRVKGAGANVTYEVVKPDETDKDFKRARMLFASTEEDMNSALMSTCLSLGMPYNPEMKEYCAELRKNVIQQRAALTEMYRLVGVDIVGIPDQWQYLMQEGQIFNQSYVGALEIILVKMVLSDAYIDTKVTKRIPGAMIGFTEGGALSQDYIEYRKQYKEWQRNNSQVETLVTESKSQQGDMKNDLVDLLEKREGVEDMTQITQMDFYQAVLKDIKAKYNAKRKTTEPLWDEYLEGLFKRISPDYGKDVFAKMTEDGKKLFCQVSEIGENSPDMKDILEELKNCTENWQVEEIIVKYQLRTALYHDSPYQTAWRKYYEDHEYNGLEKKEAFLKGSFYNVITQLKARMPSKGLGMTWDKAISTILRDLGNTVVEQVYDAQGVK